MTTQRDDLAREIFIADNNGQSREASLKDWTTFGPIDRAYAHTIADGLLAAGWTKPRTITTVDDLIELPNDSVILDIDGDVLQRRGGDWCTYDTAPLNDRKVSTFLPATVLYEPTPGGAE